MWFELLVLVIGIVFGFIRSGKEDLVSLIKQGLLIGIILGFILGVLSIFTPGGMSTGSGIVGAVDVAVKVIILAIIFIIGVMIGNFLEIRKRK
jgi:predicted permease